MLRSESGLEAFKEIIGGEVGSELRGYSTFQDFGQEGEIGDGAEVTRIASVETRFFDDGCYGSQFEGLGNRTGAEGGRPVATGQANQAIALGPALAG